MYHLTNYIGNFVFGAIFLVLFLIVGLDVVAAVIDQLGDLRNEYVFSQALIYVALTIPGRINEFIPLSALVGCLIAMGSLSSNSELTVMRASGLSVGRLVWLASRPAIILVVISVLIAEYVSPHTDQWAQSHKALKQWGAGGSIAARGGLWHREGNQLMHFNVVQPGGVLYGVTIFDFDEKQNLSQVIYANRASYQADFWLLEDVQHTRFLENSIENITRLNDRWHSQLQPETLQYLSLSPQELSISGLYEYARYLDEQELESGQYRLAFWQKSFQPLAVLSLFIIALSFVFGPLRSSTMGFRIFIGIVVGIAFQFTQSLLGPSSLIYGFSPVIAVLVPIGVCFLLGVVLLKRAA